MTRPPCCRRVHGRPGAGVFKPAGVPTRELPEVVMTLDEFEAIRLADFQGLYQEAAAEQMHVSRATFGRILESAHRKIADTLVGGKALRIEGGEVHLDAPPHRRCTDCHHDWEAGEQDPAECPKCHGKNLSTEHGFSGPCRRGRHGEGHGRCHRKTGEE